MSQRHKIEHPGSLGDGNKHLLDTLSDAYAVILKLAEQGFTVIETKVCSRNPVIKIKHVGMCRSLGGALRFERHNHLGRSRLMSANLDGVQIEWEEKPRR